MMHLFNHRGKVLNFPALPRLVILFFCYLSLPPSLAAKPEVIHLGILSIAPPARLYAKWQPFADYMQKQLGRPVELVVPHGFSKMKQAILQGKVDFFYINSYVFYRLLQMHQALAVAQIRNIAGNTTSHSEIFVRKNSHIQSIGDLNGKSIAFVSPLGAGGYMAPRAYLYAAGLKSDRDFKPEFTRNLTNSIHGVLLGDYDAGTMCGVNFKLMSQKIKTGDLKIIGNSPEYPESLIAARLNLPPQQIKQFRHQLLIMEKNPTGRQVLANMHSMKIQSFVRYDSKKMNSIIKKLIATGQL